MEGSQGTHLIQRRSLLDILDEAVRLFRRHVLRLLPWVALPIALATLVMSIGQAALFSTPGGADLHEERLWGLSMALLFGGLAALLLISVVGNTALLGAAVWQVLGRPRSIGAAWLWAIRPRVLGTALLVGLIVLAGSVMCLVPGIVFALLFGLTMVIVAAEQLYGPTAMDRSRTLIKHNPGRSIGTHPATKLFAIGFVGLLVWYLSKLVVQTPLMIVQQVLMFRSLTNAEAAGSPGLPTAFYWLYVPQTVLGTIATEAVMLYMVFAVTLLYVDLWGTKEGGDVDLEMDVLGAPRFDAGPDAL